MKKSALVFLAQGFETIEALAVVDILRRAKITVVTAAVGSERQVVSSHGILVLADRMLEECIEQEWDALILPGGLPGSENLANSPQVVEMVKRQEESGRLYGAICAAPAVVLERHGLLQGRAATCHPGFINDLPDTTRKESGVVIDRNCITGQGAGHSVAFALALLESLAGADVRREVETGLALR